MKRKFDFSINEYYHVYNRGVERKKVFMNDRDYVRMMFLLFTANSNEAVHISNLNEEKKRKIFSLNRSETLVDIGCYSLMPNHFHVLVREKIENGTSRFVKKLLTGYSMYFNTKYERSGPLFLHPFRAEHADNDRHLKYLFSYIHLNPLSISEPGWKDKIIDRDKAKRFLENYNYSSFADYMGKKRPEGNIINPSAFPDYFCEKKDFDGSTDDWINYKSRALYQG